MPASRRPPDVRLPGEEIYCPNGHKISTGVWTMSDDYIVQIAKRCVFKWPPGNSGICGAIVCWLTFKDGTRMVLEITAEEAHAMERMGTVDRLTYLNLRSFYRPRPEMLPASISRPGVPR